MYKQGQKGFKCNLGLKCKCPPYSKFFVNDAWLVNGKTKAREPSFIC